MTEERRWCYEYGKRKILMEIA